MLDKAKNYLIVFLLVCVIGAFLYGRHTAKKEVPPPPALAHVVSGEREKKSEEKKDKTALGMKRTTSSEKDHKAGLEKTTVTEELMFEQDNGILISEEKYKEMQSLILNPVKPRWAYGAGYGQEFEQATNKELAGEFYSLKGGLRAFSDCYALGSLGVTNKAQLANSEISLLCLGR